MPDNFLFIIIFFSQILLLSFYLPGKIRSRFRYMFKTYPPGQFPKLYPKSIDYYKLLLNIFWGINLTIFVAGLTILVVMIVKSPDLSPSNPERWDQALVGAWFFVQFLPMILLEIAGFKHHKGMREANSRTTRKAALQPRRLFNFISPVMFGFATLVYITFVGFIFYIRQFDYAWFGGYTNIIMVTAMNLFFAGIIIWNIYGKKQNPHQANEDRIRQIELTVKSLVFMSIVATTFIVINVVLRTFDLRHHLSIVMSLYLQLIGVISIGSVLKTFRIEDIDFEVYKEERNGKKSDRESLVI